MSSSLATSSPPPAKKQRREGKDAATLLLLTSLPNDTLLEMLAYLSIQDVESLGCVCSSWARLISGAAALWKELATPVGRTR